MNQKHTVRLADNNYDVVKATQELLQHYKMVKAASAAETMYCLHTSTLRLWLQAYDDIELPRIRV